MTGMALYRWISWHCLLPVSLQEGPVPCLPSISTPTSPPFGASPKWVVSLSSPPAHPRQPPPLYSTHFVTTRLPGAVALEGFKPRLLSTGIPSPAHASAAHLGLWQLQKGTRPASSSPEYPRQSKPLPTTDLRPYRTPAPSAQQVIYTLERSNSHLIILHVLSLSI